MYEHTVTLGEKNSAQAYPILRDAYVDFILSRQAMRCTSFTMRFYRFTAQKFLEWLEEQKVGSPALITARHVRQYVAELHERGLQDTTIHDYARAIKTLLRFWHQEGYMPEPVKVELPRLQKKRLPTLNAEQLQKVVRACDNARDKAIILFLADSGLRRSEVCALDWEDIDFQTGVVRVTKGKGQKDRIAVIGANTRRALLAYRRSVGEQGSSGALFKTRHGTRFTHSGFVRIFIRLKKRTGIHVTAHALRRTFAILSLRAGMDAGHVQGLGGWESLDMLYHYAQLENIDLIHAHKNHSPVDNLNKLKEG